LSIIIKLNKEAGVFVHRKKIFIDFFSLTTKMDVFKNIICWEYKYCLVFV